MVQEGQMSAVTLKATSTREEMIKWNPLRK